MAGPNNPSMMSLLSFVGTIIAAVVTPLTAFWLGRRQRARGSGATFEVLESREKVYDKAAELIARAHKIRDTTWGSEPEKLSLAERKARDRYVTEIERAVEDDRDYREIFSRSGEEREERIRKARELCQKGKNYLAVCLGGISGSFPMLDFLIVDDKDVILSFLGSDLELPKTRYLYASSEDLASFLYAYFDACWSAADPL